jgi:hypothetical protein
VAILQSSLDTAVRIYLLVGIVELAVVGLVGGGWPLLLYGMGLPVFEHFNGRDRPF